MLLILKIIYNYDEFYRKNTKKKHYEIAKGSSVKSKESELITHKQGVFQNIDYANQSETRMKHKYKTKRMNGLKVVDHVIYLKQIPYFLTDCGVV